MLSPYPEHVNANCQLMSATCHLSPCGMGALIRFGDAGWSVLAGDERR
jgi:hypothetical protein